MENSVRKREWVKTAAIILLAVLLVLTFFSKTIMNASLPEVATQQVSSGAINARIRGQGTVEASEVYNVTIKQTRKVSSVLVKTGQEINVGDTLFVLEAEDSDELKQAETDLETLQQNYDKSLIEAGNTAAQENRDVQNARDDYNEALAIYRQYSTMDASQLATQKAASEAKLKELQTAKTTIDNQLTKIKGEKDYTDAQATVTEHEATVKSLEAEKEKLLESLPLSYKDCRNASYYQTEIDNILKDKQYIENLTRYEKIFAAFSTSVSYTHLDVYKRQDINGSYLMHIAADGSTIASLDLSDTNNEDNEDGMSGNLSFFAVDAAGNLYVSDYNNIYVLDAEGNVQFKLDGSQYNGSLYRLNAQQVGVMWYNYTDDVNAADENGQYFVPIDLETKDWGEKVKLPSNVGSILPGDDAYDFYYTYNNNIYGYTAKTDTKEKLVDWLACDVDTNNMSGYAMLSDSRVAALMQDWSTDPTTYQLIVLHRVDASEIKEKKVLTLACMYLDWNLRSMIVEYNKTNDEYRINVVDYSEYATDDDYNAGVTKLTTEIISGSVPDIFLTSNLPIDKYAAKGVIADLNTFMDGGNGLSRDYFVPQVMSALEKDGKLYELPTSFSVQTAYALSSIASQYDTWNVAAVQDAMTQLQEGATVFSDGWTKNMALSNCLSRNLSAFVDWTTGKCEFDSEMCIRDRGRTDTKRQACGASGRSCRSR